MTVEQGKTLVMKFGGTSVGSVAAIEQVRGIVIRRPAGLAAAGGGGFGVFRYYEWVVEERAERGPRGHGTI